jgi:hypothetical protein
LPRVVMETGESHYGHSPVGPGAGQRRPTHLGTIVMLKDEQDHPTGTVAILRDVTERFEESRELKRQRAVATRGG